MTNQKTAALAGRTYFIRTFGCQMNESDSEHMAGALVQAGARPADSPESCDILLVNTCAVREKSEEKLYSYLGRLAALKKKKPGLVIGVAGCVAELRRAELFGRKPGPDFLVGPDRYEDLARIVAQTSRVRSLETGRDSLWHEFGPETVVRENPVSGYVTIMEGCDNFCAYCVVPFSRGREKYRPPPNIVREVEDLARRGYLEVQLLGQNVNSYRDPKTGTSFAALLRTVGAVDGPSWLRFITSHPKNFSDDIIDAMAASPKVCRELHLPLQSGSSAVLERMNRGYSRDHYIGLVRRLRRALPGLSLSTDIIVGFPGETEEDHRATLDVLREIRFANIFSFRYSPRPQTAAARLADDVPAEVKARRLVEVQALQKSIQLEFHRSFIGRTLTVLVLGSSKKDARLLAGRSEGRQVVNFVPAVATLGRFAQVRITSAGPYSLRGEEVRPA
ncbi:MAG: tRNA (N6-isopentenyl adenosine(37)-C2)-methylthiotransferase MiaB [Candidatus Aminicenantes bacterium]|nr:tRNA (N6-isopentenyl adenosine(37)-C2)-methylthiotransferase MiaB [Candidatus Aminicenantes bacterium]